MSYPLSILNIAVAERKKCGYIVRAGILHLQALLRSKSCQAVAIRVTKRCGEKVEAYKCLDCHTWHVGHVERYSVRQKRYVSAMAVKEARI